MSDLIVVGPLALPAGAGATLTIRYPAGWRDSLGRLSAGTYVGRYMGGAWTTLVGGAMAVPAGAAATCTLVVQVSGLPPAVQTFTRIVRDTGGGAWDITVPDDGSAMPVPAPSGGGSIPGATGPIGAAGSSFRQGAGPPASMLGSTADSYLDRTTGELYEKQAGGWVLTASLRGQDGSNGAQGPQGIRGPAGGLRPLPSLPAQDRYVPVASETAGGDGWKWDKPGSMGLRLADLTDVDLTGAATGNTLKRGADGIWRPGAGGGGGSSGSFTVETDADGYQTITNADAETDGDGYQTIPDGIATQDADGYQTVERS